jgi:hypothetical protein
LRHELDNRDAGSLDRYEKSTKRESDQFDINFLQEKIRKEENDD